MNEIYVSMSNITKSYSGIEVLHGIDLTLHSGEVLAFLGGNGAGKSTLVKILAGVQPMDGGKIELYGEEISGNYDSARASKLKVTMIHQELNVCPHLTITENIFLGRELKKALSLNKSKMREITLELLARLGIHDLDPDSITGNLSVGRQQMIEIAKALYSDSKVLIMDEPSASLSESETKELFRIIHDLKAMGTGIIYITHRLQELFYIADTVLIMRDGQRVAYGPYSDFTTDLIIKHMVGHEITEHYPREDVPRGKKILETRNLRSYRGFSDINFELYEGEVLGFTGLIGAGRSHLMKSLFGVEPSDSGQIILDGREIVIKKPADAIKNGILLVPQDRKAQGLCLDLSIIDNLALPNMDILCDFFANINTEKELRILDEQKDSLKIKFSDPNANASHMSGGNQQKLVIAKWLARKSRVIIFDEPTRGIDIGAKYEIYEIINKLKRSGIGVILISSELPEMIGISDRILVMCEGRISGELDPRNTSEEEIMKYATAFKNKMV